METVSPFDVSKAFAQVSNFAEKSNETKASESYKDVLETWGVQIVSIPFATGLFESLSKDIGQTELFSSHIEKFEKVEIKL